MKTILVLFLISMGINSAACICPNTNKSLEQSFKENAFAAYVKILDKSALSTEESDLLKITGQFTNYQKVRVEIIALYKGNQETILIEIGTNSSCDMGLMENSEWILFGNYMNKNIVKVSFCNPWVRIKNKEGESIDLSATRELSKLAGFPHKKIPNGKVATYFDNGSVSVLSEYKNDELNGDRKIFFSNGTLMESASYKNGVLHGTRYNYIKDGQISSETNFVDGKIVHSIYWYDTSLNARKISAMLTQEHSTFNTPAKMQKQTEGWFDLQTNSMRSLVYYRSGELQRENRMRNDGDIRTTIEYFKSGKTSFEMHYFKKGDITLEKRWNESGELISDKKWVNGKLIGDAPKLQKEPPR